jgi:hypothetical protein
MVVIHAVLSLFLVVAARVAFPTDPPIPQFTGGAPLLIPSVSALLSIRRVLRMPSADGTMLMTGSSRSLCGADWPLPAPPVGSEYAASGGQPRRCRGSSKLTTAMARPSPAAMRKTRS